jgi:hypothetical protein
MGTAPAPTIFANRGPGSPWTSLPAHDDAQGSFLAPFFGPGGKTAGYPRRKASGAPRIENAAVERHTARPVRQDRSRAPCKGTDSLRRMALRSLFMRERNKRPRKGGEIENQDGARGGKPPARTETLGCLIIGSDPPRLILRSGPKRVYARLQRAMAASRRMQAARLAASWFETHLISGLPEIST